MAKDSLNRHKLLCIICNMQRVKQTLRVSAKALRLIPNKTLFMLKATFLAEMHTLKISKQIATKFFGSIKLTTKLRLKITRKVMPLT